MLLREGAIADSGDEAPSLELALTASAGRHLGYLFGDQHGDTSLTMAEGAPSVWPYGLYRWVRWAALPTVFELTPTSAAIYLAEGASGVLFVPGASGANNKTREYVRRRLRRVADKLRAEGDHGLWLLWADRYDEAHSRLRVQLGLAAGSGGSGGGSSGAAADAKEENEFAIVVMGSGRILHKFAMPPPFSFDKVAEFAAAFVRGDLQREARRAEIWLQVAYGAAGLIGLALVVWLYRWCRPTATQKDKAE